MIKILKITKSAWIAFFIALLATFVMAISAHAIDSSSSAAQKYGVTFPVVELGNCADISSCRSFCEDPLNKDACISFAKKKGFYKEQKTAIKNAISIAAKAELGCDSESSCKAFCGIQSNWEKCGEFAKKHNLGGGQVDDPGKKDTLVKAKEMLGCSSVDECKGFCTKEENKNKCDEFAKLVGLRGGVEKKGPGGCTSLETCKIFCSQSENSQVCQGFNKLQGGQNNMASSSGINKEQYCREHPDSCKTDYAKKCAEYGCSWTGSSCSCPNKLGSTPKPSSSETTCQPPANGCGTYSYFDKGSCTCKSYSDICQAKGCSWTGTSCQCSTTSSTPSPVTNTLTPTGNTGTSSSVKGVQVY